MKAEVVDVFRDDPCVADNVFTVQLDIPPSVNSMYHTTKRGTKKLTHASERFIRDSVAMIRASLEDGTWVLPKENTWLYVDLVFYFPDRRRRDASNCLKILLDVLEGWVYINDYNALPRIQSVEYDKHNPRVEVRVTAQQKRERTVQIRKTKKPTA